MAQNSGKIFENNFKSSIDKNEIYYQRIKDNPSSFGGDSSFVRFTLNNPYDGFCFYKGCLFPIELKTTKNNTVSIQREKSEKGKMIKKHQIEGLTEADNFENIYAGFLFHFSDIENKENDKTYWLSIVDFNAFLSNSDKKSINIKDIVTHNGLEVNKRLKKVHYKYEVKEMLDNIIFLKSVKKGNLDG